MHNIRSKDDGMWVEREIGNKIKSLVPKRPSILLTGARQTGKTSLLKRLFPDYSYVSLDLPLQAESANSDGQFFLGSHEPPIIIDEIQYAPQLFRYLKVAIDSDRQNYGRFILTGSQKFSLMQGVGDSLAGRVSIIECLPLSARELENHFKVKAEGKKLIEWMAMGGYPELYQANLDPTVFFSDYVATYLERDVRQLMRVKELSNFERLLRLLALRTGQLLSYASLAADIGVSPNTVKAWVSILEASQIIFLIPPFFRNVSKRLIKTPKIYFHDTGLCNFLRGYRKANEFDPQSIGPLFENFVFAQLYSAIKLQASSKRVLFFRDREGNEIDFLIEDGQKYSLIEVKWSEAPNLNIRGFKVFEDIVGVENIQERRVVTRSRQRVKVGEVIVGDPVDFN